MTVILFKKPPPTKGEAVYTIDLPGATDLFHFIIPALNDKQLKKERIMRMLTKKSPVPEALQWVPDVINKIDDAQDLLTTALWLAKPLIRKLPMRVIPFVGWALTISDIANLATMTLSMSMTPGLIKPDIHKKLKDTKYKKKDMTERVAKFLKPGGWRRKFGDILQAAQASETVTGIGLTLGSVMGCASDTMWGLYRATMGERVEVRLPPEKDALTKAYRVIGHNWGMNFAHEILSPEDHALILAAQNIAMGEISASGVPINDERANILMDTKVPVYIPWEQSSIEALQEEGFDLSRENYYKPFIPQDNPTFSEAIDLSLGSILDYNQALRNEIGSGDEGMIFWLVGKEGGVDGVSYATGAPEDEILAYSDEQISAIKLSEYDFKLVPGIWPIDYNRWFSVALSMARQWGRKYCSKEDYINATKVMGYQWEPKY